MGNWQTNGRVFGRSDLIKKVESDFLIMKLHAEHEEVLHDFAARRDGMLFNEMEKKLQADFAEYRNSKQSCLVELKNLRNDVAYENVREELVNRVNQTSAAVSLLSGTLGELYTRYRNLLRSGKQGEMQEALNLLSGLDEIKKEVAAVISEIANANNQSSVAENASRSWCACSKVTTTIGTICIYSWRFDAELSTEQQTNYLRRIRKACNPDWYLEFMIAVGKGNLEEISTYTAQMIAYEQEINGLLEEFERFAGFDV